MMMNEPKIWINENDSDDKLIAYYQDKIYKANPKADELKSIVSEFRMTKTPPPIFMGIPLAYIKEIRFQEEKDYIEILFGESSYEHIKISDENKKIEIFDYFSTLFPNAKISREKYSKLKAGKKPLYAMLTLSIIFTWSLYISLNIEAGYEYEIKGSAGSLAGVVLALASLGVKKLTLIFSSLMCISFISFYFKTKTPTTFRRIVIRK